ncbi:uncharacterized protein LOC144468313 [Augochlora pura]
MNRPECPGPCNLRNRRDHCRRACLQHVATLLEELPPCIRARLRPEDVADACGALPKFPSTTYRDVSTGDEPPATKPAEQGKTIGDVGAVKGGDPSKDDQLKTKVTGGCSTIQTDAACQEPTAGEQRRTSGDQQGTSTDRQGTSRDQRGTEDQQQEAETQTVELGSMVIAKRLESMRSNIGNVSVVLKHTASRLTGFLGFKKAVCSCRSIQAMMYSAVLLVLTAFARDTELYQFFLSSQICGVIVVLCWKIAGSVPI